MTDTKLTHDVAAAFFRERDKLNIIKDGTVAHLIAVGAVKDALSAIEADRNKRAPVGSLTDEQVLELAKNAGFYSDDSLAAEFPNGYAEVQRRTIAFARALLSSVAPRVPEWISVKDRLPEVRQGDFDYFIVVCRRGHNGKTYVFQAAYLNEFVLCDRNNEDEERPFTGWHTEKEHADYDGFYEPVASGDDEVTHWMPLPAAPQPTQE